MNGTKARKLRKETYPKEINYWERTYVKTKNGSIEATGFRKEYQKAKRAQ